MVLAAAVAAAWSIGNATGGTASLALRAPVDPMLPDLAMGAIGEVGVGTTENGDARLRFAASIVNLGTGEFIVQADRSLPFSSEWAVHQILVERDGGYSGRATGAELVFGGDNHDHWHVRAVEAHQLETPSGTVVGRLVKSGFCFFDTDLYRGLPGTPSKRHWGPRGCAGRFDTRVHMGLSVGWADKYPWTLLDERIDITTVPDGEYLIRQVADPDDEFRELDETNNETWARVELLTGGHGLREVRVLEAGPEP